ncbi:MAG: RNA polymerase factor sigma-54 [Bacteroidales bacterium OttesenSCG-928-I14]|jgi:RNA polymerase sigma-54 factor|nr:RNA polymerase factor sigma-54 [Bacteroidales bacterium OttesenSCG-928-I14]
MKIIFLYFLKYSKIDYVLSKEIHKKMIKQQLSNKQQQKFSPQQIQQVKLLELTALEIGNRVNRELEENPALEEISETDSVPHIEKLNKLTTETFSSNFSKKNNNINKFKQSHFLNQWETAYSENESFHEYLFNQLKLKELSEEELKISKYIIGNLDDDGYIRQSPQTLSDDMSLQYEKEIPIFKIKKILKLVQTLEPYGIGANDLQECLLLQLYKKKMTQTRRLAIKILKKHFDFFVKKHYDSICTIYNITKENLKNIIKEITLLNPKPGNMWESNMETKSAHITPDFIAEVIDGKLVFTMSEDNMPNLKINRKYGEMLSDYKSDKNFGKKEVITFVKNKIDSAQWFIDAIKQRNITLYNTMLAVINIQQKFFLSGDEKTLKPMKLKDVSELCGYDISTISRATINKYIQTDWGIYPLRFFFSDAIINENGEEISTREIKTILKSCIETENKKKPFTDENLTKLLKRKGYNIARRTVAKYREQLNIPVSRLRKGIE